MEQLPTPVPDEPPVPEPEPVQRTFTKKDGIPKPSMPGGVYPSRYILSMAGMSGASVEDFIPPPFGTGRELPVPTPEELLGLGPAEDQAPPEQEPVPPEQTSPSAMIQEAQPSYPSYESPSEISSTGDPTRTTYPIGIPSQASPSAMTSMTSPQTEPGNINSPSLMISTSSRSPSVIPSPIPSTPMPSSYPASTDLQTQTQPPTYPNISSSIYTPIPVAAPPAPPASYGSDPYMPPSQAPPDIPVSTPPEAGNYFDPVRVRGKQALTSLGFGALFDYFPDTRSHAEAVRMVLTSQRFRAMDPASQQTVMDALSGAYAPM